ncbi:MAG: 16S rRNA (cytidine(1402)-2'-O)-methyltransferase [Candidatus Eisenbacteria sp.]|nr:16S rRNA (cytidine(1402)-2'-O)-methyltransferase [Candidatus Eisenbacteria bacterium]
MGILFLVSTPIGNLQDITLRALDVLGSVDLIAAEDTRRTRILLTEFGISKPITSYHDFSEGKKARALTAQMAKGKQVALVSEAGSPGVCDPCYRLVRAAIESGIPVVPIPGPTALIPALVVSGLPVDRFVFEGFLPARKAARRKRLAALRCERRTLIFYEAPHRLMDFLGDLGEEFGDRRIAVARELTKLHEEILRGTVSEVVESFLENGPRGELVVVCEGVKETGEEDPEVLSRVDRHLDWLLGTDRVSLKEAAREVALLMGLPRKTVYGRAVAVVRAQEDG